MANTITGLIPVINQALDTVASEPVGLIQRVGRDINAEQVAKGQTVRSPIIGAASLVDATPAVNSPSGTQTVTYKDVAITKDKSAVFTWNGDEEVSLGTVSAQVLQGNFAQAFRSIRNAVEADLAALATSGTIAAMGTAETTPFASDLSDIAQIRKALRKAGAPVDGLALVVDPSAFANILTKSTVVSNANANVDSKSVLELAQIPMIYNMNIGESAGIITVDEATDYVANMFFHRNAIQLVARAPKVPSAGDSAFDRTSVVDPATGLVYTISAYKQYKQISYEIGLAWGCAVVKPEWIGILKG